MKRPFPTVSRTVAAVVILALVMSACSPSPTPAAPTPTNVPVPTVTVAPTKAPPAPTAAAPVPTAPAPAATAVPAPAPTVIVNTQDILNDSVVILQVVSQGPGWLVVHNQQDGKVGADIGHSALITGTNQNVRVRLDVSKLTPNLYAMLHIDAGAVGTYEFPGADVPVVYQGAVVNVPFKANLAIPAAEVTVQDQVLQNNSVTIGVVVSNGPGWLVVHAQAAGKVGPDIGHTALVDGLNKNVVVNLDPKGITDVLYAMLHTDAGVVGTYEFPGADVPVTQSGNLVNKPFRLHSAAETPVVGLELAAQGFAAPVALVSPEDGTARRFIVDQVGVVYILPKTGPMLTTPFLDLRSKIVPLSPNYDERGLLGLAFHRDFKTNGRFYVLYSVPLRAGGPAGFNCTTRISEFKVSAANANVADPASERVLLELDKPQSNHNGGPIAMGYDGYLYIPLGDGGAANDVGLGHNPTIGNAQDTTSLLGKILRIDVDSTGAAGGAYGIPKDNPFADGVKGRPEIYAYGLRNPFLLTFDRGGAHELFLGMAGQNRWESFFMITKGANYGWHIREGSHCFDAVTGYDLAGAQCPKVGAAGEPLVGPILEYPNAKSPGGFGITAIGGRVYRGAAMPLFAGKFLFIDFSSTPAAPGDATLFVGTRLTPQGDVWTFETISVAGRPNNRVGAFVRGFGEDSDGEVYALTSTLEGPSGTTGAVYKLVPASAAPAVVAPAATATPVAAVPSPTAVTSGASTASVEMRNVAFNPPSLQVKVGTKVTWTNRDDVEHTTTSDTGVWDSGLLPNGSSFSFTFAQAGTFPYYCRPHGGAGGKGMSGAITVVP
jgi:plastocyanin/glucose/arabinose dehydrogenase